MYAIVTDITPHRATVALVGSADQVIDNPSPSPSSDPNPDDADACAKGLDALTEYPEIAYAPATPWSLGVAYAHVPALRQYLGWALRVVVVPDLRGADLRGADLRGAYLRGACLRGACLEGADLRGACLRGAYLKGAYLSADHQGDQHD